MKDELNEFKRNEIWYLVPRPKHKHIICAKWILKNNLDENGIIIRNTTRLVAQCYNQEEGINFKETFSHVSKLEAIRLF